VGGNGTQLFVRALDAPSVTVLADGYQLRSPFVSPRGDWIGYADKRFVLRKVALTGGPSVPLPATLDTDLAGATWLPDDTIVYATFGQILGLRAPRRRRARQRARSETLTRPDPEKGELSHLWPQALPGGHAVLFTITYRTGGPNASQVWVYDLRTRLQKPLVLGGNGARFVPSAPGGTTEPRAGTWSTHPRAGFVRFRSTPPV
jgi:hypothetical protein